MMGSSVWNVPVLLLAVLCSTAHCAINGSILVNASSYASPTASTSAMLLTSAGLASTMTQSTSSSAVASSSSAAPLPTPPPIVGDFLTFSDHFLYLTLYNISITSGSSSFKNLTRANIERMLALNYTLSRSTQQPVHQITLKRFFGTKEHPTFYIAFIFTQDTSEKGANWLLSNLQHKELPSGDLFQYKGIELSVWAPANVMYQCQHITFHGSNNNAQNSIITIVELTGLSVQPFLKDGKTSQVAYSCAGHDPNNQTIGLVVGLVLSLAVVLAAIVIIISIIVSKKFSRRGYNILENN